MPKKEQIIVPVPHLFFSCMLRALDSKSNREHKAILCHQENDIIDYEGVLIIKSHVMTIESDNAMAFF